MVHGVPAPNEAPGRRESSHPTMISKKAEKNLILAELRLLYNGY